MLLPEKTKQNVIVHSRGQTSSWAQGEIEVETPHVLPKPAGPLKVISKANAALSLRDSADQRAFAVHRQ
jgi:hypothetical protein